MITIAIVAFVLALIGGGVLEVGQWYLHRRHIQVRADAAALAAGQALASCFSYTAVTQSAALPGIENAARQYGGIGGGSFNPQLGTSSSDLMSFQSDTYPSSGDPRPSRNLNDECYNPDGSPNLMVDVKTTQAGIPSFLSFSPPFATVHGWARVELQSIRSAQPTMPLAIPDVNPKAVAVTFVDNRTGNALSGCATSGCVFPLTGPTTSGTLNDWGGTARITVPSADTNIGIRVAIGSTAGSCAGVNATATYTCYDYSDGGQPSPRGIVAIRSYSTGSVGSGNPPVLRSVTPSTCSGTPYFSALSAPSGTCANVGVTAVVEFPAGTTNRKVTGNITGPSGGSTAITLLNTGGNTWASNATSLPVGGGPYDVTLSWQDKVGTNTKNGNFNNGKAVQQIFGGSDGSDPTLPGGPIMAAWVLDGGGSPVYSLPAGSTATVAVTIGLTGGVHLATRCAGAGSGATYSCASDPPVLLRTQTRTGSHTYAVDCGVLPGHNGGALEQEIQYGCANSFSINTADVCPDPANPTPTDCAPVQTGAAVGQVQSAMNARFAPNGACLPNNYPVADDGDPRVVTLVDTDFSAFIGSGGSSGSDVPVVTLASFYVTGWDGAPSTCNGVNEPPPPNGVSQGNSANIWGHFIKYASGGTPTGLICDPTSVVPCVPALVR